MADATGPSTELEIYDDEYVGTEMYYRVPNGEVTIGRVGLEDSEKIKRVREGWVPLDAYGTFKIQPYHQDHPFEVLFQRGGAKELSVKQVIDQGFTFRPQLAPRCHATVGEPGHFGPKKLLRHTERCWQGAVPVEFPQLAGMDIEGPFDCKWCSSDGEAARQFPTKRGLRQHETVMHPDEIGSDRLGSQLIEGLNRSGGSSVDLDLKGELLKMQERIDALTGGNAHYDHPPQEFVPAATPYVCGLCGEAQSNGFVLNKHISEHKKEAVPV